LAFLFSRAWLPDMSRDRFFCGLLILAAANGLADSVVHGIVTEGWFAALSASFGISAVVLMACFAACSLLYSSELGEDMTIPDAVIGLGIFSMTIVPSVRCSWFGLTVLSLYMLCVSPARSARRRGALIALAATGPMLWGPILMEVFGPQILQADAILVSTLIGTARFGTVYSGAIGADGSPAHFAIGPPCSSLHGMSIAILAWVTISNMLGGTWSTRYLASGLLAAISVLTVNVSRLSLIGLFPAYYPTIHGSPGSEIAAWLSLILVVAIPLLGIGREALRT
jgi:exosortase/archaeosortase family protein